jgi:WD repeat-containing protein 35
MKYVRDLAEIRGQGEFCAIFTKNDFELVQVDLCNSIGTIIESKQLALEASIFVMSRTHIVACSESYVYMWQYRSQTSRLTMFEPSAHAAGYRKLGREICWFIDDKPDVSSLYDAEKFDNTKESQDPICGAAVNEQLLILGRESGALRRFTLPHITEEPKLFWKALPMLIEINSDGTRLALVDIAGVLNILEINSQGGNIL